VSYAKENTDLPPEPDYKKIDEFVMSIVQEYLLNDEI
jgi:hypothetical protein